MGNKAEERFNFITERAAFVTDDGLGYLTRTRVS